MSKLKQSFQAILSSFYRLMKKVFIPGTEGASIYDMGSFFTKELENIRLSERAAAISFNFLMAIPPTLIFLFSLVVYLPVESSQEMILSFMRLLTPEPDFSDSLEAILTDFMNNKQKELMSFSFLFILFVSSNGVMGLLRSFDRSSPLHVSRSSLSRRWKAILLTIVLMFSFLISIAAIIIQTSILDTYILDLKGNPQLVKIISWISLIFIIYISFCILYKYGPSLKRKFRFFSFGAFLATLLFLTVSYCFFSIAAQFINYNKIYGSLGTLLMFMIWMFITGIVILVGYEVNLFIMLRSRLNKG